MVQDGRTEVHGFFHQCGQDDTADRREHKEEESILFKDFKEGVFLVSALTSTNQPANNVSSP